MTTTELVAKAKEKVALTRLQSGQLSFHRYSTLAGVRFVQELSREKDVSHISLDEFARAFHGTATKNTRIRAKNQLRSLIPILIEDGWLVIPEYFERQLSGVMYVRNIPDQDDEDNTGMIENRLEAVVRQRDLKQNRLEQLKANFKYVIDGDAGDEEIENTEDDESQDYLPVA